MKHKKLLPFALFLFFFCTFACTAAHAAELYSPSWGFSFDLPEGYVYVEGDGRDRFSFQNADGAFFDLVVYSAEPGRSAPYASLEALVEDVYLRLDNRIDLAEFFYYNRKEACIMGLSFSLPGPGGRAEAMSGWALFFELPAMNAQTGSAGSPPMLAALAYGPSEKEELLVLHLSALDSIAPEQSDRLFPGPITEYAYPRETLIEAPVAGLNIKARIYEEDAEAAQALIDREFQVLTRYVDSPDWREAWQRFYRCIYRDSFERLADAAFQIERELNSAPWDDRGFAERVLRWVQSFRFERDFLGSDFVNLVTAFTEGRGDCDSRAMLWAVILNHANIPSAIMVSRYYSHAMGLADLDGSGARFELDGKRMLVAETTAQVSVGMIAQDYSDPAYWLGISFE